MDNLIYIGGEVKSLGDGKVAGYLVTFGTPEKTDLTNDFFTKSTDFDVDFSGEVKSTVYYNHGLDSTLGRKKLCNGVKATLKMDDVGVWIEAQLDERDEYESAILSMVKEGKMGWSSGTAPYLVEREQMGKAYFIKRWTLGVDASLTPTPAEYRNRAVELKSLPKVELKSMIAEDFVEQLTYSTLCRQNEQFQYSSVWKVIFDDNLTKEQKIEKIKEGYAELAMNMSKIAEALLALDFDEQQSEYKTAQSMYFESTELKRESSLVKHTERVANEVKNLNERLDLIRASQDGVKKGAMFNSKNKTYLNSVSDELVKYGTGIKDILADGEQSEEKSLTPDLRAVAESDYLKLLSLTGE